MSKTVLVLDEETGAASRTLAIDAREMVERDPARYRIVSAPQKSGIAVVAERQGNGPHALRVGRLKFET